MFPPTRNYGSNCEAACVVSCPPGWERADDHCYFWSNERKNWFEAEGICRKRYNSHLASVTSQGIHNYMRSKKKQVWIGGTDLNPWGTWVWTDCSVWDLHSGWKQDEPSGSHPLNDQPEDCMEYFPVEVWIGPDSSYSYLWNDKWCYHQQQFVCSKRICAGENKIGFIPIACYNLLFKDQATIFNWSVI